MADSATDERTRSSISSIRRERVQVAHRCAAKEYPGFELEVIRDRVFSRNIAPFGAEPRFARSFPALCRWHLTVLLIRPMTDNIIVIAGQASFDVIAFDGTVALRGDAGDLCEGHGIIVLPNVASVEARGNRQRAHRTKDRSRATTQGHRDFQ